MSSAHEVVSIFKLTLEKYLTVDTVFHCEFIYNCAGITFINRQNLKISSPSKKINVGNCDSILFYMVCGDVLSSHILVFIEHHARNWQRYFGQICHPALNPEFFRILYLFQPFMRELASAEFRGRLCQHTLHF